MKKIRRTNVNKTLELLWSNNKKGLEKKINTKRLEKSENAQCKILHYYKRSERQCTISFTKNRVLSEIKSHANQKNWNKVKNLFLLLLHLSTDIEPLIWRYSFILTLYSNIDNASNILHFFKICIGSLHSERTLILKNMLSLQHLM